MDPIPESKTKKDVTVLAPRAGKVSITRATRQCLCPALALRDILACCSKPCGSSTRALAADLLPQLRDNRAATGLSAAPWLAPSAGEPEQQHEAQGEEYSGAHWKKS